MIGIFDSGIGGLTVAKEVFKQLPEYQVLYLGDTARTPYGNRSQDLIYKFTEQAVDYLFKQGCYLVVIACNTASAKALRKLQQEWLPVKYPERRILGVIRPIAEESAELSRTKRIGVVGTKGTVSSKAYEFELKKIDPTIEVFQQACPLLVPLVEEGWKNKMVTGKIIRGYLRPLKFRQIDTLILGCTHYPMLMHYFKNI
jgi:glutamate racemase